MLLPHQIASPLVQARVGQACPWCCCVLRRRGSGAASLTRDHLIPKCRGGQRGPTLVICHSCNNAKGDFSFEQYHARLAQVGDRRAAHLERWAARNPELVAAIAVWENSWAAARAQVRFAAAEKVSDAYEAGYYERYYADILRDNPELGSGS